MRRIGFVLMIGLIMAGNVGFCQFKKDNVIYSDSIIKLVDSLPKPPSYEELLKHKCSVHYPQMARENGIQGTVLVKFVVEKDGSLTNIKVVKGIGGGCDKEVIRFIKYMPKWKPAMKNGVAVPVEATIPQKFTLK